MKKQIKFISLLLAVLLMLGSLTVLTVFGASAAEDTGTGNTTTDKTEEEETIDYTTIMYANPEEKLKAMTGENGKPFLTIGNYELYVDNFSGEVAYRNTKTGEILFTNPYDIGTSTVGSPKTKQELLSQIHIKYTDNNSSPDFYSYTDGALTDQIVIKRIKNGVRVQYTLGREQARKLVPGMISKTRFDEVIAARALENGISDFDYLKLTAYYTLQTLEGLSDKGRAQLIEVFPIVEKMDVYTFDANASEVERTRIEGLIKTYCPEYSYEDLDADHAETEYEAQDKNPPLFKLALEYTIDGDQGLIVRLPANGIRFNEQLYQLEYIEVLPYMGAGNSAYDGYTFYPDGAGSLYQFDDIADTKTRTVRGKVYGTDYAYHTITGTYQQAIRFPVFGVVENTVYYDYPNKVEVEGETVEGEPTRLSGTIVDQILKYNASVTGPQDGEPAIVTEYKNIVGNAANQPVKKEIDRGYVAIMEEGDALTDIMTYHAGSLSDYNTIKMIFNPRPSDSYNLQDSISVGSDATWTVVSERKYVGNYKIRYVMLSDSELAKEKGVTDFYETSWLGMALAYRDYLDESGYLTRLAAEDLEKDIPLYIETFGALETTQRILSIPVDVMTPLTTFEDIKTMYDELADAGVTNINFKLTGFANGGMFSIVPSKLKWEKVVGGKDGFQELVNYAAEVNKTEGSNLGIFPDFDFSYINYTEAFDGVSLRWHAVRTIDDRYASYREYSATEQKHVSHYQMAISPASFNKFYEKLAENYLKYDNVNGISVGTLGNSLNSDFDEDEPYNREDSKEFVVSALEYLSSMKNNQGAEVQVMSEGGNAFTWKYLDHLLDVALDSSRNNDAAHAVPFVGVVLHGYVNFAGSPMNMEGNIKYAMLKAIENGASPYYILSYQNTQNLKEYQLLSHYYSVRYDIWKEDVIEQYNELNSILNDVQDKLIIGHEFWNGTRVPDSDELFSDIQDVLNGFIFEEENAGELFELQQKQAVSLAREAARVAAESALASLKTAADAYRSANAAYTPFETDMQQLVEFWNGYETVTTDKDGNEIRTWVDGYSYYLAERSDKGFTTYAEYEAEKAAATAAGRTAEIDRIDAEYAAYEQYANAKEGEEGYDEYQLYLSYRTAKSRFNTTRNRRVNDMVNVNNAFKRAEAAYKDVQEKLELANELLGNLESVKPALKQEAEYLIGYTDMHLRQDGYYSLKSIYLGKKGSEAYSPEQDIEAIEKFLAEVIQKDWVKYDEELAAGIEKINNKLAQDILKAEEAKPGKIAAAEKKWKDNIAKVYESYQKDLEAIANMTDEVRAEKKAANDKVNQKYAAKMVDVYFQLQADITEAYNTYADQVELEAAIAALQAAAEQEVALLARSARLEKQPINETEAWNKAQAQIDQYNADAQAELAEIEATVSTLEAKAQEELDKLNEDILKKKNVFELTTEMNLGAQALAHFTYDNLKNFQTDLTALGRYIHAELIEEISGGEIENTYEYMQLDFAHSSYEIYSNDAEDRYLAMRALLENGFATKEYLDGRLESTKVNTGIGEETEESFDKYAVKEGSIVVVTYGGKNGVDEDPYKSIILNYNNFSVSLEYEGLVYTLPAYGYVVVMQ